MVKTRELTIGNYINDMTGGLCEVRGTTDKGIWIRDNSGPAPESAFDPILLTKEILPNLGFSNEIDDDLPEECEFLTFFKGNMSVELIPDKFGLKEKVKITIYEDIIDEEGCYGMQEAYELEYEEYPVHKLQNLYYELFDEELTWINK